MQVLSQALQITGTMMTVAEKVKTYRLKKAWSQEQLAEVASLSVRTVQRTEKGQKPSLETLTQLLQPLM